jgi:serine/threonine protein kinase/tetratricopeptide (TPR) repeat protein
MFTPRYRLRDVLGEGAMGVVYRAIDRLTGQAVALKRVSLSPDLSPAEIEQELFALAHEFRLLASLRHPHIVSVLDYGFDADRQPFFTMELLTEAQSILAAGKNRTVEERGALLIQAFEALAYLHRRGILHHDLKPANVLVAAGQVRLLDFGLAVSANQHRTNDAFGTLQYLAPEVLIGQPYTAAADLYSLGVIAYELFAGRHPYPIQIVRSFLEQVQKQAPDLACLAGPPALVDLVDQLLAKSPATRPAATATIRALQQALGLGEAGNAAIRESYLQAASFVGREQELEQLRAAITQTQQGQGSAWLIGGESGVGKSRLLDELRVEALVVGFQVLSGQAVEGSGLPYQLWREPLRRLMLSTELSDLEASVLKELVPDIDALLGREVLNAPNLEGKAHQERLHMTIVDVFRRQTQPTLLLLEDLHWASESLEPLKALQHFISELSLSVFANYRSDERPNLTQELEPNMHVMLLQRLPSASIAALSSSMLGETGAEPQVVELLQRETEGNVFFLVEVVRALAEEAGDLERIGRMSLPRAVLAGGVQQVVRRRLGRMPAWGQGLLKLAAVVGRQLDLRVLVHLDAQISLEQWLNAGTEAAIFEVRDEEWRFSHDKLREALLKDLTSAERPRLHRQVAEAIEAVYPNDPARAEVLLEHWQIAGDPTKEATYIQLVVEKDGNLNLHLRRNQKLLERGLTVITNLPHATELRMTMLRQLGNVLNELGQIATAKSYLQQSLALAQELDHLVGRVRVLRSLGVNSWREGGLAEAGLYLQEALSLAHQSDQQDQIGSLLNLLGIVAIMQGDQLLAQAYFRQAAALQLARDEKALAGLALNNLGMIARAQKEYAQARAYLTEALSLHRAVNNRYGIALALGNLGTLAYHEKDYDAALGYLREALQIDYELNIQYSLIYDLVMVGRVYTAQRQWAEAQRNLTKALSLAQELKAMPSLLEVLSIIATYYHARGQDERAVELAGLVEAHPATPGDNKLEFLEPLLAELQQALPTDVFAAALLRGQALDLETVAQELANELAQPADSDN